MNEKDAERFCGLMWQAVSELKGIKSELAYIRLFMDERFKARANGAETANLPQIHENRVPDNPYRIQGFQAGD